MPTTTTVQTWISPIRHMTDSMLSSLFGSIVQTGPARGTVHRAIDIVVPVGTPVFAPREGRVSKVEYQAAGGNVVTIDHAAGWQTVYAHLDRVFVKVGDAVDQGQRFANSGSTGAVTGPHLHWEVKRNGTAIDPLDLFDPFADTADTAYQKVATSVEEGVELILANIPGASAMGNPGYVAIPNNYSGCPTGTTAYFAPTLGNPQDTHVCVLNLEGVAKLPWQDLFTGVESTSAGIIGGTADVLTFILDPANWMRAMALLAGAVLAFVGFRIMWEATSA